MNRKWNKVLFFALGIMIFLTVQTTTAYAAEKEVYIHQKNFSTDYELKGLFGSCTEYFQTEKWDIKDVKLKLSYTATTIVKEEVSDFTVSINGQPVYSQKIPLTSGETQELTIEIPSKLIQDGLNSIQIESYIRTSDDTDPCKDDASTGSWMVITKESVLSLSYMPRVVCQNVADVYTQLTGIEGLENKLSGVFIPTKPSENELTSAAYVLTGVAANASSFYDNLPLLSANTYKDLAAKKYGVYIAEYERLLPEILMRFSNEQKEAAQAAAVIVFLKLENGQSLLVVTGKNEMALQNACRLFGNQDNMKQTKAVYRKVSEKEDVNCVLETTQTRQLTQLGSYAKGAFRQTLSFPVVMEANKSLAAGSEAEIHFRYAQNLDFTRSLITVYVGDIPIGSKKLEKESADGDILKISIPDNLQITGNFQLNVTFDLEVQDLPCSTRNQDMPWAFVSPDSSLLLIKKDVPYLLFELYPSPFIQKGEINQTTIVLPVEESAADIEVMRKTLLTMGRYQTSNAGNIRVCRADNMGDLSKTNIVSIGCLEENPIVWQINNQLYFRFSPGGTTILSNEKIKIEPNYGATLGTAQLLYSPYSAKKYALLIISGVTEEGMLHAGSFIGNVEKNWQIYGDAFVTDGDLVNCYRFGDDNNKQEPFMSDVMGQRELLVLLTTGSAILILLILSLFMIWRKHHSGGTDL